ncbi:MAG: O-antigen ligase family protein, partial [Candidatus Omnitrophota bacterium]
LFGWIFWKNRSLKTHAPLAVGFILFLAGLGISVLINPHKTQGFLHLGQYINAGLLFLICQNLSLSRKERVIWCLLGAGVWISFLDMHQFFFGFQNITDYMQANHLNSNPVLDRFINEKRVFTPFITSNILGGFLILLIPLAFSLNKYRWIVAPLIAALILTKSVGAIVSLCLASLIYFIWNRKTGRTLPWIILTSITGIGLIILLRIQTADTLSNPLYSGTMRWNYWVETWQIIKNNPWTGTGLGNFDLNLSRYSHNSYLQLWAETGLAPLLTLLFLIMTWLRLALTSIKKTGFPAFSVAALIATGAFLIHNTLDFTLLIPETGLIGVLIAGLCLNPPESCQQDAS